MIENIKIDIDEVKKYVNDGLLSMRKHPVLDLYVLKYTPEAMFTQKINRSRLKRISLGFWATTALCSGLRVFLPERDLYEEVF